MSDRNLAKEGFIPFSQSTPIRQGGSPWNNSRQRGSHNRSQRFSPGNNGGYNKWNNKSRGNSSFESDRSNSSFKQDINAYLHPSMLQDPWAQLREQMKMNKSHD